MYEHRVILGLADRHCLLPLLTELGPGQRELLLGEPVQLEPLHYRPLPVLKSRVETQYNAKASIFINLDGDWEAEHNSHGCAVAPVTEQKH